MKAIIISREKDRDRRARIREVIPTSLDWEFLEASDGHRPNLLERRYAKLLPRTFWEREEIKPGAFGCFVSHYRAWVECVRQNTDILVLEDDVVFFNRTAALAEFQNFNEWEFVFVNKTAVAWNLLYQAYKNMAYLPIPILRRKLALKISRSSIERCGGECGLVTSLRKVICGLVGSGLTPENYDTPGGCGYVVTPIGARKMLEIADTLGAVVGVDWFMLGGAVSGAELIGAWELPIIVSRYFRNSARVKVGVSNRWLVESRDDDVGGSVINHAEMIPIDEYGASVRSYVE